MVQSSKTYLKNVHVFILKALKLPRVKHVTVSSEALASVLWSDKIPLLSRQLTYMHRQKVCVCSQLCHFTVCSLYAYLNYSHHIDCFFFFFFFFLLQVFSSELQEVLNFDPGRTCPISPCSLSHKPLLSAYVRCVSIYSSSSCQYTLPVLDMHGVNTPHALSLRLFQLAQQVFRVVACLWLRQSVVWTRYSLLMHLSVDGRVDRFCFLAITNNAAVNVQATHCCVHVCFQISSLYILGNMVILCVTC